MTCNPGQPPGLSSMAKKQTESATVEARVLIDCMYGKVNDVVEVLQAEAEASTDLDSHPDSVAYAKSLK